MPTIAAMQASSTASTCSWVTELARVTELTPDVSLDCRSLAMADGLCVGHSPDPNKDSSSLRAAFAAADTRTPLNAAGWVIPFAVDLVGRQFSMIDCRAATFLEEVKLRDVEIDGKAWFNRARFLKPPSFLRCQFRGATRFDGAIFATESDFESATFSADAEFRGAEFRGFVDFSWAVFSISPSFSQAVAERGAKFEGTVFKARATFDETWLGPASTFDECDLSLVGFRGTRLTSTHLSAAYGLASAEFESVIWSVWRRGPRLRVRDFRRLARTGLPRFIRPMTRYWSGARSLGGIVYEERLARTHGDKDDFLSAEKVYRELRRGAEARRDYLESNRLHIREMEMRRLRKGNSLKRLRWLRSNVLSLEALYRTLSLYGMRAWQPACWLAVLLLVVFPVVFAVGGFEVVSRRVELWPVNWPMTWDAYGPLVAHTMRTASLVADLQGSSNNAAVQATNAALRVIGPLFALLVSLAIRRRFRS